MQASALTLFPIDDMPASLRGGVVAIGNFDGVHRGHVALIEAAVSEASRRRVPAVVLTFEPHPRTFFRPAEPVFRLTPLAAKARLLAALGIDGVAVAAFDAGFAGLAPDDFAAGILDGKLGAAATVVGHDFRYGKGRVGTAETLVAEGARLGFGVTVIGEVADDNGHGVSSSAIRKALAEGDVRAANHLLGHRWFVAGEVIHGERRGRDLGFPTANIRLEPDNRLRHGIYAVETIIGGKPVGGVASFGRRPTFDNGAPLLEVFFFDFAADLYGQTLAVAFLDWIRPELKFESIEALVAAIGKDVEAAKKVLAGAGPGTGLDRRLALLPPDKVVLRRSIG